jgi:hypothetical protein
MSNPVILDSSALIAEINLSDSLRISRQEQSTMSLLGQAGK